MEAFPEDFTLEIMQHKMLETTGFVPKLRKLFHESITKAVSNGYKAALIVVDQPESYPDFARKIVSAEVANRFPGALYGHCVFERLDMNHFESVGCDGAMNFEFLVLLDPDLKPWPAGSCKKRLIRADYADTLCKTKIGCY